MAATQLRRRKSRQASKWERSAWMVLIVCATVAALGLYFWDPTMMRNLRLAQFDQFQRWYPRAAAAVPLRVVDIDDATLQRYGQWPWPRTLLAELIQRLRAAGAKVVALDALFMESDRTSPRAMAQLWKDPAVNAVLKALPDHDEALAQTLAGGAVVLGALASDRDPNAALGVAIVSPQTLPFHYDERTLSGGSPVELRKFSVMAWPLPVLADQAAGLGALNIAPTDAGADGVLRRVPLLLRAGGQLVPSLSAEALRVFKGQPDYSLIGKEFGEFELQIGDRKRRLVAARVPTNRHAELWLHYTQERPRPISAAHVLGGTWDPKEVSGNIVLVGSSSAGLYDLRTDPFGETMPGVQTHALALEQMLTGHYLQRPQLALLAEAMLLLLGAVLVGGVGLRASAARSALVAAAVVLTLLGAGFYAFAVHHLLLDVVNPALAILLSFVIAGAVHHFMTERERSWVRAAFSRYVSPNRVAYLMAHPEHLRLGGERRVCSFVFTDLAGFTRMMEGSDPAQVVALLNAYLEGMLEIAFKHEGTLERIMGDAVAVLFSAPVTQANHRQLALDCALAMDRFATGYAQSVQAQGVPWGHTRIGVHSGEVMVGNFGGKALFDYRALGDPINTASRLESVNRSLGTRVCISQAIMEDCPDAQVRPVGRLLLMGKSQAVQVYEPLAATDPLNCAPIADYTQAMQCLQEGQAEAALVRFEALALGYPKDPLVLLHLKRLREGAKDDLIVMTGK